MDAAPPATSTNTMDAVFHQEGSNKESSKSDVNIITSKTNLSDKTNDDIKDDLLAKIEEVVKDNDNLPQKYSQDYSQASEQDFLKKLDECAEFDTEGLSKKNLNETNAIDTEKKSGIDSIVAKKNVLVDNEVETIEKNVESSSDSDIIKVNKEIFVIEDDVDSEKNDTEKKVKSLENAVKVNQDIFVIDDDDDDEKKDETEEVVFNKEVIVNKEVFVIEDDDDSEKKDETDKVTVNKEVIVNKEVFVIEDDDDNEKKDEDKVNEEVFVIDDSKDNNSIKTNTVKESKLDEQLQKEIEPSIINKNSTKIDIALKNESKEQRQKVKEDSQIIIAQDLLKNTEIIALENEQNKRLKLELPHEKSNASQEPMIIDLNESSTEKMDVEEDKTQMDVDIVDDVVSKDEEMKIVDNQKKENVPTSANQNKSQQVSHLPSSVTEAEGNPSETVVNPLKRSLKDFEKIIENKLSNYTKSNTSLKVSSVDDVAKSPKDDNETIKCAEEVKQHAIEKTTTPLKTNAETLDKLENKVALTPEVALKKLDNKLLAKVKDDCNVESLTNSPIQTQSTNVFNSTPINKQFEISSENVSKISNALENSNKSEHNIICESHIESPKVESKQILSTTSTTSSTTITTTDSGSCDPIFETDNQSSDEIAKYINTIKNGIADSTTTDDGGTSSKVVHDDDKAHNQPSTSKMDSDLITIKSKEKLNENTYEIHVWNEANDIKFLSVQRIDSSNKLPVSLDHAVGDLSSLQGSSNGSVSSLPPFTLPPKRPSDQSSGSISDNSSKMFQNKSIYVVKGISELCSFMIDHFKKIQKDLKLVDNNTEKSNQETTDENKQTQKTTTKSALKPRATRRSGGAKRQSQSPALESDSSSPTHKETGGRLSKMSCESPSQLTNENANTPSTRRNRKRSIGKVVSDDDEDEIEKPKVKQAKRSLSKIEENEEKQFQTQQSAQSNDPNVGQCVLARWIDKKYYAGKILETKPGNKFVVRFEDGATKLLQRELIVFGENGILPLSGHKIYASVKDDYECGIVTSIDKIDKKVFYTVITDCGTVKVTASDIYLQDDQVKSLNQTAPQPFHQQDLDSSLIIDGSTTRHTRNKRAGISSPLTTVTTSPEPGTSAGATTGSSASGKKGKRSKRTSSLKRTSESSDITYVSDDEGDDGNDNQDKTNDKDIIIEGIQQEYQRTVQEIEDQKLMYIYEYRSLNSSFDLNDILGCLPKSKTLFKNKCFLLTCTIGLKPHLYSDSDKPDQAKKNKQFSKTPFVKNHLQKQIQEGGGTIYENFDDIPKSKYRQCVLIAPKPCYTAKYVQCLAANIKAVTHDWIIDSCNGNKLAKKIDYSLPTGWSITLNQYIDWIKGKLISQRKENQPFIGIYILICSYNNSFIKFWSNTCKLAGAMIRYIKTLDDITPTSHLNSYMIVDSDFPQNLRNKAEHFNISIVSSIWVVQSLIMGKIIDPKSHCKLTCMYSEDDEYLD